MFWPQRQRGGALRSASDGDPQGSQETNAFPFRSAPATRLLSAPALLYPRNVMFSNKKQQLFCKALIKGSNLLCMLKKFASQLKLVKVLTNIYRIIKPIFNIFIEITSKIIETFVKV